MGVTAATVIVGGGLVEKNTSARHDVERNRRNNDSCLLLEW